MKHRYISTFAGAMGLDIGIERTGAFECVAAIEMDPKCCDTIRANHEAGRFGGSQFRLYETDITRLDPRRLRRDLGLEKGQLELLVGGPPCTTFSTAGKRRATQDPQGLLAWHLLLFVAELMPQFFVIENVLGLKSARLDSAAQKGSVLRELLKDVPEGYRVDVFEVDASDYGVPQHRRRLLIVGNRLGVVPKLAAPTHGPNLLPFRTFRDAVADLPPDAIGSRHRS